MIFFKENIKNVLEFNLLYDAVGWESYDEDILRMVNEIGEVNTSDIEKELSKGVKILLK